MNILDKNKIEVKQLTINFYCPIYLLGLHLYIITMPHVLIYNIIQNVLIKNWLLEYISIY